MLWIRSDLMRIRIQPFFLLRIRIFGDHFALLDPDQDPATQINADPDPPPLMIINSTGHIFDLFWCVLFTFFVVSRKSS